MRVVSLLHALNECFREASIFETCSTPVRRSWAYESNPETLIFQPGGQDEFCTTCGDIHSYNLEKEAGLADPFPPWGVRCWTLGM